MGKASGMYRPMADNFRKTMLVLTGALLLAGCEAVPSAPPAAQAPESAADRVAVVDDDAILYRCDNGQRAEITLDGPERARLKIAGAATDMIAVRAASGAKFESADGGIMFWSKGSTAQIDNGNGVTLACSLLP